MSYTIHKTRRETYITFQRLHTTELTPWKNTDRSYIYLVLLYIIQWMRNNHAFLWYFTDATVHTTPLRPHLHKILPHAHHSHLHNHIIIHKKILPHTYLHKILPGAHDTPLHPHTIIHTDLLKHWPFARTRKHFTNDKFYNIKTYPGYITIYTRNYGWDTVPSIVWCKGCPSNDKTLGSTATLPCC